MIPQPGVGPPPEAFLQWPSTASSGRRLIVTSCGDSYGFLPSPGFDSRFIQTHLSSSLVIGSVIPTTPASPRCHACIVQDRQNVLRPHPTLHIDFLIRNPARRFQHGLVLPPPGAEFAFPMRRNLSTNCCRSQMGHVAKELHRALPISVFQLAIRRAHGAQRLDAALDALRDPRTLAVSQLPQRFLPDWPDPTAANAERLLLRNDANANFSVSIYREGIEPAPADIHRVDRRQIRHIPQIPLRQLAVLAG